MRGRKPNPRRASEGDTRKIGARKLAAQLAAEPNASRGLLPPSKELTERASEIYRLWSEELKDMDLDRRPDSVTLSAAATQAARGEAADVQVSILGAVIDTPIISRDTGEIIGHQLKKNPWLEVSNQAWILADRLCSNFGLSGPASRTRLAIERKDEGPDLAAILSTPRLPRPVVQ